MNKHIYDIKDKNSFNFVLPKEGCLGDMNLKNKKILVVIYLYYETTIGEYIDYIKNVPQDVQLLLATSEEKTALHIKERLKEIRKDYQILVKENRGRDISALLVSCRQEILKSEYICFVHDKNISRNYTQDDVAHFIECMWENTLGSEDYIYNVIDLLERESNVGVLLTPEPLSTNLSCFIENTWYGDFDITCQLTKRLGLNCKLLKEDKPVSVGTAFWAKTEALKKLFDVEWKYEDFDEEPLANDGTISHAIERCFSYVANDAGFDTGIVMSNQFAAERIAYLQNKMTQVFQWMGMTQGIGNLHQFENSVAMLEFVEKFERVYIYGAGLKGQKCLRILRGSNVTVSAFIVSEYDTESRVIDGISIIELDELENESDGAIVVAVSKKHQKDIIENLHSHGYKNICLI